MVGLEADPTTWNCSIFVVRRLQFAADFALLTALCGRLGSIPVQLGQRSSSSGYFDHTYLGSLTWKFDEWTHLRCATAVPIMEGVGQHEDF